MVTSSIFVLFSALLGSPSLPAIQAEDPAGDWGGVLNGSLRIVVHITKPDADHFAVTMDSPDQGAFGIKADRADVTKTTFTFSIDRVKGNYEGTWDDKTKSWLGTWNQGQKMELNLKRVNPADAKALMPKRPQEEAIAATPVPYSSDMVTFGGGAAHVTLAGTLTRPKGSGPFPSVVLVAGSGPNTRDEPIFFHKEFLVLADHLTRQGFAVLRYDKRGVGASTGSYMTATTADFIADAGAAIAYLRTRKEVDNRRIGLIGHSEGGLIAPAVAAQDKGVAFIVMMAGPGLAGAELIPEQEAQIMEASGASTAEAEKQRDFSRKLDKAIADAPDEAEAKARGRAVLEAGVKDKLIAKSDIEPTLAELTSPWMRYFLRYDPAPSLRKLTIPVLALNGSLDLQVSAKANLPVIREALKHNQAATVLELPKLNHLFQTCKTGSPSEYSKIETTVEPSVLQLISDWILKQIK